MMRTRIRRRRSKSFYGRVAFLAKKLVKRRRRTSPSRENKNVRFLPPEFGLTLSPKLFSTPSSLLARERRSFPHALADDSPFGASRRFRGLFEARLAGGTCAPSRGATRGGQREESCFFPSRLPPIDIQLEEDQKDIDLLLPHLSDLSVTPAKAEDKEYWLQLIEF